MKDKERDMETTNFNIEDVLTWDKAVKNSILLPAEGYFANDFEELVEVTTSIQNIRVLAKVDVNKYACFMIDDKHAYTLFIPAKAVHNESSRPFASFDEFKSIVTTNWVRMSHKPTKANGAYKDAVNPPAIWERLIVGHSGTQIQLGQDISLNYSTLYRNFDLYVDGKKRVFGILNTEEGEH